MMTPIKIVFSSMLMACLIGIVGISPCLADTNVVAMVGAIPITRFELERQVHRILPLNVNYHGGVSEEKMSEIREKALQNLVEQAYKVQYAVSEEISVSNADVEKRLEPVKAKFNTPESLKKALGEESLPDFRATIYRELLGKKAEEIAVKNKARVTDIEVNSYYEQNKEMFMRPQRYRASHILVKVDPALAADEREKLLARAQDLARRAKSGEDFYNLAYYNSDEDTKFVGGDVGYFHSGQVVKEFEDAIKTMKPGDISSPVETISGYHVIKLVEIDEPAQLSFDEVKASIRSMLEKKKYDVLYEKWITPLKTTILVQRY